MVQCSNTVCGVCHWLIGGEGRGPKMERRGFGKKEATQMWSKMPSPLGSSSQGLVCAQVWGLE